VKLLISGVCGQVGSHVAEMLLARGDEVLGIDNLATGRREHLVDHQRLKVITGSIADRELVDRLFAEFKPDDWYNDTLTNCVGGANLIQASKRGNIGRFIYFQTALCYGVKPMQQPIRLDHPKLPANSSYAISKTAAEDYLEISGVDYVTFRLANVVGPRNVSGPLPIFFQRLSEKKRCFVTKARRDFVFVKDLARTVLRAADGAGHGAYHFSSGKDVAIQDLYDAVVAAMELREYPAPEVRELGPDDAPSILLDPSRTFQDFGKVEFTGLGDTVAAAVEYYRKFGVQGGYTHLKHEEKK